MSKKRYNWKARQVVNTIIDNTETKKLKVEFQSPVNYDQSNELVLPSKKRKTKIKKEKSAVTRILSRKHRKRLEKIVEKKKKKEDRASLLESLQKVQASKEELSQLLSIASVQTKGLKRYLFEESHPEKIKIKNDKLSTTIPGKLNALSGAKRRKIIENDDGSKDDPNIVGFDSSESDVSDSEDDNEENNVQNEEVNTINGEEVPQENNINKEDVKILKEEPKVIEIKDDPIPRKKSTYVNVIRSKEIQKARLKLPILSEEQEIMETINENLITIIAGETGSGKTTQIPQFLYEAGYALKKQIAVTEPRRVAAIAMSERVAEEMNMSTKEVGYLIRFEGNVTEDTKIKFMTDGVLLKELQNDFILSKYSVVVLDEAHERSVYTDILIGLLSRIVPLRHKRGDPLKLIIMSATLRLEDFTLNSRLFKSPPPVIKVDARQYPVTVHFNKRTYENYIKEAFNKAVKVHTKLPDGGILIFVTGQQEVKLLVKKLRRTFPLRHKKQILAEKRKIDEELNDASDSDDERIKKTLNKKKLKIIPEINLDDYSLPGDQENDSEEFSEQEDDFDTEISITKNSQPLWTLPLYSLLPSYKQQRVFQPPPPNCRLCVVSTNVAETSLTIPNVKYVIDTGKEKIKLYDKVTGVTTHIVHWTSKACADQRAGRAGRMGPGHCYRLYSSAVFNDTFKDFSPAEIQEKPVDDLYLQMKCMNIDKVVNFPFPTAPDLLQLKYAESRLETLGALKEGKVTALGRAIAKFPVLPRYGKMLALSHQQDLLPYTICLVAALSVQEVLLEVPIGNNTVEERKEIRQKWASTRQQWAGQGNSLLLGDNMVLLRAVGAAEFANSQGKLEKFCTDNGLRHKAVVEIRKLRIQLTNEIKRNIPEVDVVVDPQMKPPTDLEAKLLRQLLLAGMGDQLAKKIQPDEVKDGENKSKYKYAYQANDMEEPVFLHQNSVLKKTLPEFVVYQEIYETNKMYMRGVTAIEPEWLPTYVPKLCNLSEPMLSPEPKYDPTRDDIICTVTGTVGTQAWSLPIIEISYPKNLDAFKWFARFLLQGEIFTKLKTYVKHLLSQPSVMVKNWAKLQPRTEALLKILVSKECRSKKKLEEIWNENPQFLLNEYLQWLPESAHGEVSLFWPPLDNKLSK